METAINIFLFGDEEEINAWGYCLYEVSGTDDEIVATLSARVETDHPHSVRTPLSAPLAAIEAFGLMRTEQIQRQVIDFLSLPDNTPYVITPIISGVPRDSETLHTIGSKAVPDFLKIYMTESGLDMNRLLDDDFLDAIRLLWNDKRYISALKLIFPYIDTLAFLEFGEGKSYFVEWLDTYCDMRYLGVTSSELWQLRNSVVHMTNTISKRVAAGRENQLNVLITHPDVDVPEFSDGMKSLHLSRLLLRVLPNGLKEWADSYRGDSIRQYELILRYDTILSDVRLTSTTFDGSSTS